MREPEAAAYLGVSTRTLYRYRKAGKLACREIKGKARPVIDYDEADLGRLKREFDDRRTTGRKPAKAAAMPAPKAPRVTFGLSRQEDEAFRREAARYELSPGEYARRLVREGLESRLRADAAEMNREVHTVRNDVKRLRAEVAGAFEAVLEYVGLPPEEAKQWVIQNLR